MLKAASPSLCLNRLIALECAALFVPVEMRQTGTSRCGNRVELVSSNFRLGGDSPETRETCSYAFVVKRRRQHNFSPGWHFDGPQLRTAFQVGIKPIFTQIAFWRGTAGFSFAGISDTFRF
jgi:hypothetical protein